MCEFLVYLYSCGSLCVSLYVCLIRLFGMVSFSAELSWQFLGQQVRALHFGLRDCRFKSWNGCYSSPLEETVNQGPPVCIHMHKDHIHMLNLKSLESISESGGSWKQPNNPVCTKRPDGHVALNSSVSLSIIVWVFTECVLRWQQFCGAPAMSQLINSINMPFWWVFKHSV